MTPSSSSFAAALADVATAFGSFVAEALRRAVLRDCADEEEHPDSGVLRRSGRFAWFEARGAFFGRNRYALERGEVCWLPTPVYRDELRGASALLARYVPLTPLDEPALMVVLDAFADNKIPFVREDGGRRTARGALIVDTLDPSDGERGRVVVELATGMVRVERDAPAPAPAPAAAAGDASSSAVPDSALLDDGLRALLVSAHKNSRKTAETHARLGGSSDLDDATTVDAHPPTHEQPRIEHASSSSDLEDATEVTDVDKTRRNDG